MATSHERKAYKEVLIVLEKLDLIQEIPQNVLETLKAEQDNSWKFEYDETLPLEEQDILRDTAILFSNLYLAFICKDENEKKELKNMYDENQKQYNNIHKNSLNQRLDSQKDKSFSELQDTNSLIVDDKKTFWRKFLEFFKKIFQ